MFKKFYFLILSILLSTTACATPQKINGLYVNSFGKTTDQPIIFIHGGPGFNSANFEVTTADALSKLGFYVIVYDEKGQGRSDSVAIDAYNYKAYSDDIQKIIQSLNLNAPVLLGHSHGGPIAIKYDEYYPNSAKLIILVSAPINFWDSMQSLYDNCSMRYMQAGFPKYKDELAKNFDILKSHSKDTTALVNSTANVFAHGLIGCKLYSPSKPTDLGNQLNQLAAKNLAPMEENSMPGFLSNENYIYLNHFEQVSKNKGRYFGIYGNEDGLFTPATLGKIKDALNSDGTERFFLVTGASHSVFIDQNEQFLNLIKSILKK